jgi:hypothetical protein
MFASVYCIILAVFPTGPFQGDKTLFPPFYLINCIFNLLIAISWWLFMYGLFNGAVYSIKW